MAVYFALQSACWFGATTIVCASVTQWTLWRWSYRAASAGVILLCAGVTAWSIVLFISEVS